MGYSTRAHRAFVAFGSNLGDRIAMIEEALRTMESKKIRIKRTSSLWETKAMYVLDQAQFFNGVCEVETDLEPLPLLDQLQEIESSMGRQKVIEKGPRNIDLDILLYDQERINIPRLIIPHPLMLEREFVLRPLCELIPSETLPSSSSTPSTFKEYLQALPTSEPSMSTVTPLFRASPRDSSLVRPLALDRPTHVMGILNLTPDSFSDGVQHAGLAYSDLAVTKASEFAVAGASIIDIGGQSTRPGAEDVGEAQELDRVIPAIQAIRNSPGTKEVCISVDTYRARVAEEAVRAGADMINDVSGGTMDEEMFPTVARLGCTICIMHMRGTPKTMTRLTEYPGGIIPVLAEELRARVQAAEDAGIRRWRIILDTGIGFAKTQAQNLEILRRLPLLRITHGLRGLPWLLGPSRKGFIGKITKVQEPRERIWGTAAAVSAAVAGGADIVRVHDVAEMVKVTMMADAIWRR
ncbi:MAG: trifunctional dihydropteroate synthetase [Watsoniomyces obsoletus]|nr:MAG: trifunctional dihydropteroate synthetase [Watsoniomyces obsoletus]